MHLNEKGVHIVTVNDYLAKRDSQEMGKIYNFLGLTSGFINNNQNDFDRKKIIIVTSLTQLIVNLVLITCEII